MVAGPIKLKNIKTVTANTITATNILSFKEDHVMNIVPQFIPNTYQGLGVLERAKWRVITFTLDSDSDVFAASWGITTANTALGTSFIVTFDVADALGTVETWTYTFTKSWVQRKENGRIEDGASRNSTSYQILMYGTKIIT